MSSPTEANGTAQDTDANKGVKIIVYWLESSRAQRVLILLEELNLKYEIKTFKRNADGSAAPALKDVHPLGKSPVISLEIPGKEKPLILAETGAIFEYLVEFYGPWLVPAKAAPGNEGKVGYTTEAWLRNKYLMHYTEGSLMNLLALGVVMMTIKNAPLPFFLKPLTRMIHSKVHDSYLQPNYDAHFGMLEGQLKTSPDGGEYFCGKEVAEADFMLMFPLQGAKEWAGMSEKQYPLLCAFLERMKGRESYKKAEKRIVELEGSYKPV